MSIKAIRKADIVAGVPDATVEGNAGASAWLGYWPGAGSISSETRVTRFRREMLEWKAEGAQITPLYINQAECSALEARIQVLEAAVRRQVENIERWLETGEPASAEESRSIYEQLRDAIA